ncbi:putative cathepsin B8 cysteine protease [Monocercomonoides exilis]|uniref:putative cathepsin B8 cysteine protease n=1 Tax=Monocercomonoides exilis TaxID=2049356 RepID=UPI0035595147|nr:putative cathepsin B8 cysteine protease [Monocercomonoides exilis]
MILIFVFGLFFALEGKQFKGIERLPDSYDMRKARPGVLGPIRNHERCNAYWAFAASTVFTARYNIKCHANITHSVQDLISCDLSDNACIRGNGKDTLDWIQKVGITDERCFIYTSWTGHVTKCIQMCHNGSNIVRHKYSNITYYNSPDDAMYSVMNEGPVVMNFPVDSTFEKYSGGVYAPKNAQFVEVREAALIGWGNENGQRYFIGQAHYGEKWGEGGYFRLSRNLSNDMDFYAGTPKCN